MFREQGGETERVRGAVCVLNAAGECAGSLTSKVLEEG